MKKIFITLAVITAIAVGAYFIFRKKKCTDCENKEEEEEEPMKIRENNFVAGSDIATAGEEVKTPIPTSNLAPSPFA